MVGIDTVVLSAGAGGTKRRVGGREGGEGGEEGDDADELHSGDV